MDMNLRSAVLSTVFGLCLIGSYYVFPSAWAAVDKAVFFFFNARLEPGSPLLWIAAYTNLRAFDAVAFVAMGLLYLYFFLKQDNSGKRRMVALGICMLLVAVLIKQCGNILNIRHPSPTLVFKDINRLSKLVDIAAKDASRNSFPGDHGMMLMVFAGFVARYFGKRAFVAASAIVVVFSLPRIISGAHWFSDVFMGSLAIVCITLGWFLCSPASDWCAGRVERLLPARLYPPGGKGMFG